jgi:hypothetical protein
VRCTRSPTMATCRRHRQNVSRSRLRGLCLMHGPSSRTCSKGREQKHRSARARRVDLGSGRLEPGRKWRDLLVRATLAAVKPRADMGDEYRRRRRAKRGYGQYLDFIVDTNDRAKTGDSTPRVDGLRARRGHAGIAAAAAAIVRSGRLEGETDGPPPERLEDCSGPRLQGRLARLPVGAAQDRTLRRNQSVGKFVDAWRRWKWSRRGLIRGTAREWRDGGLGMCGSPYVATAAAGTPAGK